MKQFVNYATAEGSYRLGDEKFETEAVSNPAIVTGGSQCVCRTLSVSNAACIIRADVCHVATRAFRACGHNILRAEYGIRVRYTDCNGCEHSAYEEGDVLFFDLPLDTRVLFLNPPTTEIICGGDIRVCFQVVLECGSPEPPCHCHSHCHPCLG